MPEKLLTPKFLTAEVASDAIMHVARSLVSHSAIPSRVGNLLSRQMYHVVVLVPAMKDDRPDYRDWPNYPLEPAIAAEHGFGDSDKWPYDYADMARCKALQLWHDRNDGRTDIQPHLLFPGDTPFWGGVKRSGIVVACSGVQSYFDQMISGMVADMCIALAYHAWKTSPEKADDELCFLP